MRILYVTSSLPHGKGEAFVVPEIEELKRRGHEVLIVPMYPRGEVLHGDVEPLLEHAVVKPLISPEIVAAALGELRREPAGALKSLARLFGSRSAKILLKNLTIYPKGLWLARLVRDWRADHVHVHWAATSATMALVACELSRISWSITAHRFDIAEDNLLDLKARKSCFMRAIDERGARELAGHLSPIATPPVVIHMGVVIPSEDDRVPAADAGTYRVVVPANLVEKKGHAYLLEAVRVLKDRGVSVHADFAGIGPLRETLARRAEKLGLDDRVTFLGALPHEKLLGRLRAGAWDMVVLPSIVTPSGEKEGIPVALIEALSCRVPAVSTTTGGIPELFEGMEEALCPPEDPVALAETIEKLLIEAPELRERLVESGRRRVEESFAIGSVVDEMLERFEAGVGGGR